MTPTKPGTLKCIFATDDGCSVYDKRPMMCRLFGTVDDDLLRCPHGIRSDRTLGKYEGHQLRDDYIMLIND